MITNIGDSMPINSVIPSPIFETLRDSEDTLRTTLAELAEDKRKQRPNISERKLAEYLADQMGYRGAKNVEALVASRERILKSRQAVGLSKWHRGPGPVISGPVHIPSGISGVARFAGVLGCRRARPASAHCRHIVLSSLEALRKT